MTYTLLSASARPDGTLSVVVTIEKDGEAAKRRRLTVPKEDYAEAGFPKAGQELFPEDYEILTKSTDKKDAVERAYKILAFGDNTKKALLTKLQHKGYSADAAAYAVSYMEQKGFLKEEELLRRSIAACVNARLYGKRKTFHTLLQKGFSGDDITNTLADMEDSGEIDFDTAKMKLLFRFSPKTPEEKKKLLFKYGY